jgi:NADH-quinone oxidoreductase subunit C
MAEVNNEYVAEKLKARFGDAIISVEEPYGCLTVTADSKINIDILQFLWDDEAEFRFMVDLCGVHFPDQELPLGVVYHIQSLKHNLRIRFKFWLPLANPVIKTAVNVYSTANWLERETYDFFGIIFDGHPDLRRILNVDEMEVFPMRKEYPLEDPNRIDKKDLFFGR